MKLDDPVAILRLVMSCGRETLDNALKDPTTINIIAKYKQYEDKVRKGYLGKTAVSWFSFIEHSRHLFLLLFSVKVNKFLICSTTVQGKWQISSLRMVDKIMEGTCS